MVRFRNRYLLMELQFNDKKRDELLSELPGCEVAADQIVVRCCAHQQPTRCCGCDAQTRLWCWACSATASSGGVALLC